VVIAFTHYFYAWYLDKKFVANTIPQNWNAQVSTLLVQLFSWILTASCGVSFTQFLWYYLRRKPAKISTIDTLFDLPNSPWKLFDFGSLRYAPILWLFGIHLMTIPIAANFATGVLSVTSYSTLQESPTSMELRTLDVDFRGNGTYAALISESMFLVSENKQCASVLT